MTNNKESKNGQAKDNGNKNLVIGIGASAGGVEALQQLFDCIPDRSGLTFVVIQHLSPDYKSLMGDILRRYTNMDIYEAKEGMELKPDTVYLNPPKKHLSIVEGRRLHLTDVVPGALNHPIDAFFHSLADQENEKAIAVVMSGTGSDGTSGVKDIKERGGLVIAQEPSTAKFDGMPKSVINMGLADFILSPEGIVEEILNYSSVPTLLAVNENSEHLADDRMYSDEETLAYIYTILKNTSGIDFTYYKRSTILRRIERRMIVTHSKTLSEFARILGNNDEEVNILIKEILIGVTNFFRDPPFFEKLKQYAVHKIVENTGENEAIRIWSAGCSTGEEAYSVAILFKEVLEELDVRRDVKIFATDVDAKAVEKAGKGIYPESIVEDVNTERLSKYFIKQDGQYRISKDVRKMIIFAPHNMFSDPPFGKLDLIICRNVMIYFQPILRRGLFAIFHSALKKTAICFWARARRQVNTQISSIRSAPPKKYIYTKEKVRWTA